MRSSHTARTFARAGLTAMTALVALSALALADDKAAKPKPPVDAKPVAPRPPPPPLPEPPIATMPTPAAAVGAHVKAMKRSWRCKGSMFLPDGNSIPSDGTLTMKLDLDKFWAHTSYVGKGKHAYKFESYRTLDPASGKWHQVMVDNVGGQEVGTSAGPEGAKIVWLTEARGPMGAHKSRHTEERVGKELKLWGETSMDGKSWIKAYEVGCK